MRDRLLALCIAATMLAACSATPPAGTGALATPGAQSLIPSSSPSPAPTRAAITDEVITFIQDYEIHVIRPDGSGERSLTATDSIESGPSWSPDGSRLAYTLESSNVIFFINADGGDGERIDTGLAGDASAPRWSPDGKRLAFGLYREGGASIYAMNSDGSGLTELYRANGRFPSYVDWSPDGKRLAFVEGPNDSDVHVYVMDADGSRRRQVTAGPGADATPRWSRDGSVIAFFNSERAGGGVFTIEPDGTGLKKIFGNPLDARVAHLAWSPDGTKLALVGEFSGEGNIGSPLLLFAPGEASFDRLTDAPASGSPLSWRSAP